MNLLDGPTFEQYEREQERLHRLNKRRNRNETLMDYEYEEMEDDVEWLLYTN